MTSVLHLPATSGEEFARRAQRVRLLKRLLPGVAAALLVLIVSWPQIDRAIVRARAKLAGVHIASIANGVMVSPRYRGLDGQNQPYVVTADTATRVTDTRTNLVRPKADLTLRNGDWFMAVAPRGVYEQETDQLDLDGWVTLYRADGTQLTTPSVTLDGHQSAAASAEQTHVEGPFGTLDAQGFTMVDKGNIIQFRGPAKLVLNDQH